MKDDHLKSIQEVGVGLLEGGKVLYCNGLGGLSKVEMDPSLDYLLNTPSPIRGNNVLAQLKVLFRSYPNGPWYIDCINGIIFIHNSKFSDEPVTEYTFKDEPGEVLSVNISLQDKHIPSKSDTTVLDQFSRQANNLKTTLNKEYDEIADEAALRESSIMKPDDVTSSDYFIKTVVDPVVNQNSKDSTAVDAANKKTVRGFALAEAEKRRKENIAKDLNSLTSRTTYNYPELVRALQKASPEEKERLISSVKEGMSNAFYDPDTGEKIVPVSQNLQKAPPSKKSVTYGTGKERKLGIESNTNIAHGEKGIFSSPLLTFKDYTQDAQRSSQQFDIYATAKSNAYMTFSYTNKVTSSHLPTGTGGSMGVYGTNSEITYAGGGSIVGVISLKQAQEIITRSDPEKAQILDKLKEQENLINNLMRGKKEKELVCNMVVVGRPSLTAYRNLNVYNISNSYSGTWYIKTVEHTLTPQNGYTTTLSMTFIRRTTKNN